MRKIIIFSRKNIKKLQMTELFTVICIFSLLFPLNSFGDGLNFSRARIDKMTNEEIFDNFSSSLQDYQSDKNVNNKIKDYKIRDFSGIIPVLIKRTGQINTETNEILHDRLKFYQYITGKKFWNVTEKKFRGQNKKQAQIYIGILEKPYLVQLLKKIEQTGVRIEYNKSLCYRQIFYNKNQQIQTISLIINGSLSGEQASDCIESVLFHSLHQASLFKNVKNGDIILPNKISLFDIFNIRLMYDKRTPPRLWDLKYSPEMNEAIEETRTWLTECFFEMYTCE